MESAVGAPAAASLNKNAGADAPAFFFVWCCSVQAGRRQGCSHLQGFIAKAKASDVWQTAQVSNQVWRSCELQPFT